MCRGKSPRTDSLRVSPQSLCRCRIRIRQIRPSRSLAVSLNGARTVRVVPGPLVLALTPAGMYRSAYIVVGSILWCVMQSIGELATLVSLVLRICPTCSLLLKPLRTLPQIPTAGSFPHWATRFIDPAVGFSLGTSPSVLSLRTVGSLADDTGSPIRTALSYGYCYTIAIASEVSAASVIVSYWTDISPALVISIGLALILFINLMPIRLCAAGLTVTVPCQNQRKLTSDSYA